MWLWLQDVCVSSSRPVLSELSRSCDPDNSLRSRWFRGRRRCWGRWHGHGLHAGTSGRSRQGLHGDGGQADNQNKNNPWGIYICNATTRFYNRSVHIFLAKVRKYERIPILKEAPILLRFYISFFSVTQQNMCKLCESNKFLLGSGSSGQAFFKLCNDMTKLHPRSGDCIFPLKSRNLDIIEWSKKSNNARKEREVKI